MIEYAVVDDYGDNWEHGNLAFRGSLDECFMWAEDQNFHSASIVRIYADGRRELYCGEE